MTADGTHMEKPAEMVIESLGHVRIVWRAGSFTLGRDATFAVQISGFAGWQDVATFRTLTEAQEYVKIHFPDGVPRADAGEDTTRIVRLAVLGIVVVAAARLLL